MKRRNSSKGIALIFALFALAILMIIGFTLQSIMTIELQSSMNRLSSSRAYYYAMAGVARAEAELKTDYYWSGAGGVAIGSGSYTVSVWADPNNNGRSLKIWKATCTGASGSSTRTIVVWLQQDSFAKYAYFTDREQTSSNQTIWFVNRDSITGAAHTNGYFNIYQNPKFSEKVDSANNSDPYFDNRNRNYRVGGYTYTDTAKFYHTYNNYNSDYPVALNNSPGFSFSGGQANIPLPGNTNIISSNANYTYNGNTTITLLNTGSMQVTPPSGRSFIQPIPPQGATVFVNGTLNLSGTLKGRLTIGTNGNINITDNVLYSDRTSDVLGLVSGAHIVIQTNQNVQRDMEIDAAMMALNTSFYVDSYQSGVPRGTLHIFGGIIQKNRGAVGTFNGSNGSLMTGYSKDYVYDSKLLNYPPLNFPTTGQITIKAIQDMGALGH
ncbi:MAG: hypothetical protein M1536_09320 [Firmicutes bacterium]|nr:hypothetical protein [Bacillota bacterium]